MALSRKHRWAFLLLAAPLAAGLHLALRTPPVAPVVRPQGLLRVAPEKGMDYVYDVRWTFESAASGVMANNGSQGLSFSQDFALDARLVLGALGPRDGLHLLSARFDELRTHRAQVLQADALADREAAATLLRGRTFWLTMSPRGEIASIFFEEGSPALFRQIARSVVSGLRVTLPQGGEDRWSAVEPGTSGDAAAEYERIQGSPREVRRSVSAYRPLRGVPSWLLDGDQRGEAHTTAALGERGMIAQLSGSERFLLGKAPASFGWSSVSDFQLIEVRPQGHVQEFPSQKLAQTDLSTPIDEGDPRDHDRQLIKDLSPEKMSQILAGYAGGPAPQGFVTAAGALLRLDPTKLALVEERFLAASSSAHTRALALDVLLVAGTPRAQELLRKLLSSPQAREQGVFPRLLQRLALVRQPTEETARFAQEQARLALRSGQPSARKAALLSEGALAVNLARGGDTKLAEELCGELRQGLRGAKNKEETLAFLGALGNARQPEDARAVAALRGDDDALVRREVAFALRHLDAPEARSALLELGKDAHPSVASSAYRAMAEQPLDAPFLNALADLIARGETNPAAHADLLSLLKNHLADGEPVLRALQALQARSASPQQSAAIARLIAQVSPQN